MHNDILASIRSNAEIVKGESGGLWDSALTSGKDGAFHCVCSPEKDIIVATQSDDRENSWVTDYIVDLSPDHVIALLDRLERVERENERLRTGMAKASDFILASMWTD